MFRNIFKTEKRIDENYLDNKFNEIRSIRKHVPNADNLPIYTQDLNSEMIFIFTKMNEDKKIKKIFLEEELKQFIRNKYSEYYSTRKYSVIPDDFKPMNNPL